MDSIMLKNKHKSSKSDLMTNVARAVIDIKTTLEQLVLEANIQAIDQVEEIFALEFGFPVKSLSEFRKRASALIDEQRSNFNRELQEVAEQSMCQVQNRTPHVSVGCVVFKQKKDKNDEWSGEWSVSVIDHVEIEVIRTYSGRFLAEHALRIIKKIENALEDSSKFIQDLLYVREVMRGANDNSLPANLMMVLCSHGRALKKLLKSSDSLQLEKGLSRAQFGFLLRRISEINMGSSSPKISLIGATQLDTKQVQSFISVPDKDTPRSITHFKSITSIKINE